MAFFQPKRIAAAALFAAPLLLLRGVQVANASLPVGVLQAPYANFSLTAINGTPPYTWSSSGLPPGIALSTAGAFTGTPTAAGSYFVGLQVVDNGGANHVVGLFLDVYPPPAPALWSSRGLFGGSIRALAASPNYNLDSTIFSPSPVELYRSVDGGQNWSRFLIDVALPAADIVDIALSPVFQYSLAPQSEAQKTVIVLGSGRVYKSINHGASFTTAFYDPLISCTAAAFSPNYAADATLWTACTSTQTTNGFVYRSQDRGANWSVIHTFTGGPYNFTDLAVSPNFASDQTMFLLDANFLYVHKSVTGGSSWTQSTFILMLLEEIAISPRYAADQTLFIRGATTGLQISTNGGVTFSAINLQTAGGSINGLTLYDRGALPPALYVQGDQAGGHYSAMSSLDYGLTFTPLYSDGIRRNACCGGNAFTVAKGGKLFFGSEQGMDASSDGGFSFAPADKGVSARDYDHLAGNGATVVAGLGVNPGWYKSGDSGQSWVLMPQPVASPSGLQLPFVPPNYAADRVLFLADPGGLYRSADGGVSFTSVLASGTGDVAFAPSFTAASGTMFAATSNGLYRSVNGGQSFSLLTSAGACPLDGNSSVAQVDISPGFAADQTVFHYAKFPFRLCKSVNGGNSWVIVRSGLSGGFALSPAYNDTGANGTLAKLFFLNDGAGGLLRSLDGGFSYTSPTGLSGLSVRVPAASPQLPVDATVLLPTNSGVYRSSDNGASFAPLGASDQLKPREATSLYLAPTFNGNLSTGSEAVATTRNAGLWRSSDGGRTFAPVNGFSFVSPQVNSIVRVPGGSAVPQLLAATGNQGVFRSDDGGLSFANISRGLPAEANARAVVAPAVAPSSPVTAVPGRGLWRLNGSTWGNVGGATLGTYNSFGEDGAWIYAMRQDGVSLRSNTGGASWVTQDAAQTNLVAVSFNNQPGPTIASTPGVKAAFRADSRSPGVTAINTAPLWSVSQAAGPRYSTTNGGTWTAATGLGDYVLPGGLTWTTVTALGINAASGSREVLAATTTGLWRTADGGETWRSVSGIGSGLEASSRNFSTFVTAQTGFGTDILIGATGSTTGGVFLSGDGGEHWTQVNQGFDPANLSISSLVKTSCSGCPVQYYSGSYGSGVYTRTITVNAPPAYPSANAACFGSTVCSCVSTAGSGPQAGGQSFKLCGANFQSGAAVEFGGIPVNTAGCTYTASTITCTSATPPHVPGSVTIHVRNPDTRAGTVPNGYVYVAGTSRGGNTLRVAKSGADAGLSWTCSPSCTAGNPARVYRGQDALLILYPENYNGGAAGSFTNIGAVSSNYSYFWSVE